MFGKLRRRLYRLMADIDRRRRGAATAEYALILALVAIALIGSLTSLREALDSQITEIVNDLQSSQ
ncbi:MAG: Flp family type IVb pilin [Bacillota bacterium]